MRDSIQMVFDALYDAMSKESDAAAAKVREAISSLAQQFDAGRDEVSSLEKRVATLEQQVADLQAKFRSKL
jgi:polyhydroxyalkanoate synthesis regulator phasin